MLQRRALVTGLLVSPAIVRADSLMKLPRRQAARNPEELVQVYVTAVRRYTDQLHTFLTVARSGEADDVLHAERAVEALWARCEQSAVALKVELAERLGRYPAEGNHAIARLASIAAIRSPGG